MFIKLKFFNLKSVIIHYFRFIKKTYYYKIIITLYLKVPTFRTSNQKGNTLKKKIHLVLY